MAVVVGSFVMIVRIAVMVAGSAVVDARVLVMLLLGLEGGVPT